MPTDATDCRLPEEKLKPWLDLVRAARSEADREAAKECYFETILPDVLAQLDTVPQHQELRAEGIHTLISLMGFSPETTVISAAVVRPQKLIVIYGAPDDEEERCKVQFSYNIAHRYLTSHGILEEAQIEQNVIDPIEPIDIYTVIREAIDQTPTIHDDKSALVDITGGKKVMSASGAQSAWEARLPLLYVEGKYDGTLHRPWPGTESVLKLQNPSQQELLQMRIDALSVYATRNYSLAVEAFDTCEANRSESRLDVLAGALCRAYVRWTDLDLPRLKVAVDAVRKRLEEPRLIRLFRDRKQDRGPFLERLDALTSVAGAEPLAMIATYQELAHLYRSGAFQRFDFACLLVYRGMEAVVEYGLRQVGGDDFDLRHPDWPRLGDEAKLESKYVALSKKVDQQGTGESGLPRNIGFVSGVALLCLVSKIHRRAGVRKRELIHWMRQVAQKRNESVLAHGTRTLSAADYDGMNDIAGKLAGWVLGDKHEQVKEIRTKLKPLVLEILHDPTQY